MGDERPRERVGDLAPFEGFQIPGIGFEGGHCLCVSHYDASPIGAYDEVWLVRCAALDPKGLVLSAMDVAPLEGGRKKRCRRD